MPKRDPHTGRTIGTCTPHDCARACLKVAGCKSFKWNHATATFAHGQRMNQCGGGAKLREEPKSYCEFSKTCTTSARPSSSSQLGTMDQWHTYVLRKPPQN